MIETLKITYQYFTISNIDSLAIFLTCFAGNLAVFAFGYPFVKRAVSNLSKISEILRDRVSKRKWVKYYPYFLRVMFILYLIFFMIIIGGELFKNSNILLTISSMLFLIFHIFYVMKLYDIIDSAISNPFIVVSSIKNTNKNIEDDIAISRDLILHSILTGENKSNITGYFKYLIEASFHKWNITLENENQQSSNTILSFYQGQQEIINFLLSTINSICYISRVAVDTKSLEYFTI